MVHTTAYRFFTEARHTLFKRFTEKTRSPLDRSRRR